MATHRFHYMKCHRRTPFFIFLFSTGWVRNWELNDQHTDLCALCVPKIIGDLWFLRLISLLNHYSAISSLSPFPFIGSNDPTPSHPSNIYIRKSDNYQLIPIFARKIALASDFLCHTRNGIMLWKSPIILRKQAIRPWYLLRYSLLSKEEVSIQFSGPWTRWWNSSLHLLM